MCGNSHVCLSRFAAAFFAHGKPSTAESSASYDKQSGHVNMIFAGPAVVLAHLAPRQPQL